jgi:hypothetical protein
MNQITPIDADKPNNCQYDRFIVLPVSPIIGSMTNQNNPNAAKTDFG